MPIITDKIIRNAECDGRSEIHVWDDQLPGFGVRVRTTGHKTYVLYYRPHNRQRMRKLTLGVASAIPAKEARRLAREYLGQIAGGKDPADKRLAYHDASLKIAYEAFKRERLPSLSREHARHRERVFDRHFLPKLGDKVLNEISRTDIKEIIDRIAKTHRVAGSNAHRAFSAFLSWALDRGMVQNHVLRGTRLPTPYKPRERTLTETEVIAVWRASAQVRTPMGDFFRMLLASGQRRREVASMHWHELDLERGLWTIPAHRTKNRREHTVPISSLMRSILETSKHREGFVFPAYIDAATPINSFGRPTDELRKLSGVSGFRLHDLRRTAASLLGKIGIAPHVIEAVLNHRSGIVSGIAAIYNRYGYEQEKREALERLSKYLLGLVSRSSNAPVGDEKAVALEAPNDATIYPRVAVN